MINVLYLPELREMLADDDAAGLVEFCTALHPGRTAEFMEGLSADEQWRVLQHADMATRVEIFGYIDPDRQVEILETGDQAQIGELIGEMPPDDRVDLLKEVEPEVVEELLPLVPSEERRDILRLQSYHEGTAGSVMTTEVAKLPETLTVRQAIDALTHQAEGLETIYYIYIVDDEDHLRGLVSARQLLSHLKKPDTPIADLMERDLVTVEVTDDQEKMAAKVARYDLIAIPVVDEEYRLLGIITHDDVIDVVREEAIEDAHRAGAVEPLRDSYIDTPILALARNRGLWLTILFAGAILTALVLDRYDEVREKWIWLGLFVPLVISSGGNSGSQSAALIISALTAGHITVRDWWLVVRRELMQGLLLGAFLGLIGYLAAVAIDKQHRWYDATVIPITLLLVVCCGTLAGSLLPMLFRRLGLDPAMMSTPFVAGIIDLVGVVVYMETALLVLSAA